MAVSKTVGSLWGPVAVGETVSISRPLAVSVDSKTVAVSVSRTVGTLWGPVGVTDSSLGISISLTLAKTLGGPVAVRGASGVKAGTAQSAAVEGSVAVSPGISRSLTDEVSESTGSVATISRVDTGLTDESTGAKTKTTVSVESISISVSITLAKTLWGSVAVGGTSSIVKASTAQSAGVDWSIAVAPGISRPLSD